MVFNPLPGQYVKDSDNFPLTEPGQGIKFATVTYQTPANTPLFFLPNNCEIIGWEFTVQIAFNAGTTNTLDVGIPGTPTQFATAIALTGINTVIVNGFTASQMYAKLAGQQVVTARYNQSGTAASAGTGVLTCYYLLR